LNAFYGQFFLIAMKFEKNLATGDRIVRLVFASVTVTLFFLRVISGPLAAALLALSFVLLLTVLFSFCPIYRTFGINNRKKQVSNKEL